MRTSIWTGLVAVALGVGITSLTEALIAINTMGALQSTATTIAIILFIFASGLLLGFGISLIIHWILGFGNKTLASIAEVCLAFATIFIGIGAAAMSRNFWTGLQLLVTFISASITLLMLSFVDLFGGITQGVKKLAKQIKKRTR